MQFTFDDTARLIFCTLIPFQRSYKSNNAILWCMICFTKDIAIKEKYARNIFADPNESQ